MMFYFYFNVIWLYTWLDKWFFFLYLSYFPSWTKEWLISLSCIDWLLPCNQHPSLHSKRTGRTRHKTYNHKIGGKPTTTITDISQQTHPVPGNLHTIHTTIRACRAWQGRAHTDTHCAVVVYTIHTHKLTVHSHTHSQRRAEVHTHAHVYTQIEDEWREVTEYVWWAGPFVNNKYLTYFSPIRCALIDYCKSNNRNETLIISLITRDALYFTISTVKLWF